MTHNLTQRFHLAPVLRGDEVRFKNMVRSLVRLRKFYKAEKKSVVTLPLRKRLRSLCLGFYSRSYVLYDLDRNDHRLYLQDAKYLYYTANDPHFPSIRNKLSFTRLMENYGLPHPRSMGFLHKGHFYSFDDEAVPSGRDLHRSCRSLVGLSEGLVFKPVAEGAGAGILLVRGHGNGLTVNGTSATLDELVMVLATVEHYYVTPFVEQAAYARELYASTPNTVRLLSVWDYQKNEPFVAAAAHRIGMQRSFPVDNFHQGRGGLSAAIDVATGALGPGITFDQDMQLTRLVNHPETGARIEGVVVPFWEDTCQKLMEFCARLPHVPTIGLDLIITEQGCSVLEANCPPGVAVWQVHGPLLADPRVRRCYEEMGILKPAKIR
ncbi:MAG: hypothetical protein OEU36_11570 [Gammaproteobacteria bacterium]|nr:hypothetical protein [Gammaproteobacteria bacterium]